jgi:hypothetical protein
VSATGRLRRSNLALPGEAFATRRKDDFYRTPAWAVRAIWPHLGAPADVCDPCAGDGAILDVAAERGARTRGLELDGARAAAARARGHDVVQADALAVSWGLASAYVTNPPYVFAREFLSLALGRRHTVIAFLLRLGFLASQARVRLHRENPCDLFVLPRRPAFTGSQTDNADYAWMVWGPGRGGRWSVLDVERAPS